MSFLQLPARGVMELTLLPAATALAPPLSFSYNIKFGYSHDSVKTVKTSAEPYRMMIKVLLYDLYF